MSGVVKQRATAPPSSTGKAQTQTQTILDSKRTSNGSATLSYPSEASDDVNMNEVDGLVALDVTLPDGKQMDITVDYNTPMIDLLVCLAGKSKLSPSGLLLQLFSEDDDNTPLTYTPNQVIGALGGRHVRLVHKKARDPDKGKHKSSKKQPFEMTNRFTVNLPRGQKTVLRVSPIMTVGDLMTSVCQEKDLDRRKHLLQLPGKPGMPVDLGATVGQLGVFEITLINVASLQERNHTNSMPDLSQVPTYMPGAGETKKKRGFLSFLSKKDRKFKPQDNPYTMETSSNASHQMSMTQNRKSSSPPPHQRRVSDTGLENTRPKSMFVTSNPDSNEFSLVQKDRSDSQIIAPTRKKRKAPAPPAPGESLTSLNSISSSKQDINDNESKDRPLKSQNGEISHQLAAPSQRDTSSSVTKSQSVPSRAEMLSRLHSRNSSDSSGYHELTLSGCESPEAGHNLVSKSKTSIDSASIESSDINNGLDSGIHDSPVRVSPIEEVLERSDSASVPVMNNDSNAIKSTTLPMPSRKKKKAPAPPDAPILQPPTQQPVADIHTAEMALHNDQHQSVQESQTTVQVSVSAEVSLTRPATDTEVFSPPDSFNDSTTTQSVTSPLHMNEDPDLSDEDINAAFDIDDILNGVTFDDEPRPLPLKTYSNENDEDAMMMMETSSITSENIEQAETLSKSDRPCAFIPPPPPTEPPPELETVYTPAPVLIDKETEVNDDNTSLAPASVINSPESDRRHMRMDSFSSVGSVDTIEGLNLDFQMAIRMGEKTLDVEDVEVSQDGYKNEMALFVERMSKMSVENEEVENHLNDSLSSGVSVSVSETNSDTGSVIQHLRTDSSDSKSGLDSGSWSKKDGNKINGIEEEIEDPSDMRVSEEITAPSETVPPPPEFDDVEGKKVEDIYDDDDDEEEKYTETIEELIIPLGPHGFDFTAARRVPDLDTSKKHSKTLQKENESMPVKNGVFRAEPVSITPSPTQPKKEEKQVKEPEEKEEFILTTDDLSSVSFLPPRPKTAFRVVQNSEPEKPQRSVSSAVLIMDKSKGTPRNEEDFSTESIQSRVSQLSFTPRSEPETDSVLEVKSISLLNRPTMRVLETKHSNSNNDISVSTHSSNIPSTPESSNEIAIETNNPIQPDPVIEDTVKESSISVVNSQNIEIEEDVDERPSSRSSNHSSDSREQQSQYNILQLQFAQWEEQLAQNQQQLPMNEGNGDKAASVEFPSVDVEQEAAAAEPISPPPPPAPPAPAASGMKVVESSNKSGQAKTKVRPKPKFERELDPREELMISIRNFQSREALKSVAKKDTKWIHSNR